jgi:uncharacterized protein YciI
MRIRHRFLQGLLPALLLGFLSITGVHAADVTTDPDVVAPAAAGTAVQGYDRALAERLGSDARGMRRYVLVILKTGPRKMPEGEQRKAMFAGHFANIERLAAAGKLVMAGPFSDDAGGWRGLFLFAVDDIHEARRLTATDPVIVNGEMIAEYHAWYGSAAAMLVPEIHKTLTPPAQ